MFASIRRLREDQRQTQQQALFVDPAAVLQLFPDRNGVPRRDPFGEGWRTYDRVPELDSAREGKGGVDPSFYPGPREGRYPHRLKTFLIPGSCDDLVCFS